MILRQAQDGRTFFNPGNFHPLMLSLSKHVRNAGAGK